jgi:invasion protein IalB
MYMGFLLKKANPVKKILLMLVLALAAAAPARAADSVLAASHGGWKVYSFPEGGKRTCYMAAQPEKQEGNYSRRGEPSFFVTRWPGGDKNAVSVQMGYGLKDGDAVSVDIQGRAFTLRAEGEGAWTQDAAADTEILKAMKAGATMTLRGTSARGTKTEDTYSLKGVSGAYGALEKECGKAK